LSRRREARGGQSGPTYYLIYYFISFIKKSLGI